MSTWLDQMCHAEKTAAQPSFDGTGMCVVARKDLRRLLRIAKAAKGWTDLYMPGKVATSDLVRERWADLRAALRGDPIDD